MTTTFLVPTRGRQCCVAYSCLLFLLFSAELFPFAPTALADTLRISIQGDELPSILFLEEVGPSYQTPRRIDSAHGIDGVYTFAGSSLPVGEFVVIRGVPRWYSQIYIDSANCELRLAVGATESGAPALRPVGGSARAHGMSATLQEIHSRLNAMGSSERDQHRSQAENAEAFVQAGREFVRDLVGKAVNRWGLRIEDGEYLIRQGDYAISVNAIAEVVAILGEVPAPHRPVVEQWLQRMPRHEDDGRAYISRPAFAQSLLYLRRYAISDREPDDKPEASIDWENLLAGLDGYDRREAILGIGLMAAIETPTEDLCAKLQSFVEELGPPRDKRFDDRVVLDEVIADLKRLLPGREAPDFSAADSSGRVLSLSSLRGSYVYVDFWGTWCAPCYGEFPHLEELRRAFRDEPVEFVSVAIWSDSASWMKTLREERLGGYQLREGGPDEISGLRLKYALNAFPRFILVDPEGNIVTSNAPRPSENAAELIRSVLDSAESDR